MTQSIFDLWAEKSDSKEVQEIFQIALAKLTSLQRQVVEAVYFDGHSIERAAAHLGITKSTAPWALATGKINGVFNNFSTFSASYPHLKFYHPNLDFRKLIIKLF